LEKKMPGEKDGGSEEKKDRAEKDKRGRGERRGRVGSKRKGALLNEKGGCRRTGGRSDLERRKTPSSRQGGTHSNFFGGGGGGHGNYLNGKPPTEKRDCWISPVHSREKRNIITSSEKR